MVERNATQQANPEGFFTLNISSLIPGVHVMGATKLDEELKIPLSTF